MVASPWHQYIPSKSPIRANLVNSSNLCPHVRVGYHRPGNEVRIIRWKFPSPSPLPGMKVRGIHGENLAWIVYLDPKADNEGFAGNEGLSDPPRSTARPDWPDNEAAPTAIHVKRSVPLERVSRRDGNVALVFLCEPTSRNEPIPFGILLVGLGARLHVSVAKDI